MFISASSQQTTSQFFVHNGFLDTLFFPSTSEISVMSFRELSVFSLYLMYFASYDVKDRGRLKISMMPKSTNPENTMPTMVPVTTSNG